MSSSSSSLLAADRHTDIAPETFIDVQRSPDRTAAAPAFASSTLTSRSPRRLSGHFAWTPADATVSKSPSLLKRRLSQSSPSNPAAANTNASSAASPSMRRSFSSLSSSLHSHVVDALTTLHRQHHYHQSPTPVDHPSVSAALSTAGLPMLTRSISASAADEEESSTDEGSGEEAGGVDELSDMPVFITSLHTQHSLPSHLSSASPHIAARFPSPKDAARTEEVEEDQSEDSTPLLVSSQPSSPAYTPSQTITTTRQHPQPTPTPHPSVFPSPSLSSSSPSSSPSFQPSLTPYTLLHPVEKWRRCSRWGRWTAVVLSLVGLVGLVVVVGLVVFHRVVLYMTTGSVVYQDYEFYSTANAARRLYPEYYTADGHYTEAAVAALQSDTCPAPANHTNPMPVINITPAADEITHLHIVVAPNSWTLFPWLWDSILINHTWSDPTLTPTPPLCTPTNNCHLCPDPLSTSSSCNKYFPADRLAVHLVSWPIDRRLLGGVRTLLLVGEWWMERGMYEWLRDEEVMRELHPEFYLMTLLLMGEECLNWNRNWTALQAEFHPRLAAMFTTYGDCHLNPAYDQLREVELPNKQPIDMGQNIVYWPLGPSVEHGFPSRWLPEEEDDHSAERQRDLLLNLMVSITWEKSTRMQAWMVTTEYCQQHSDIRCYNHNNDLIWKAITTVDNYIGTSFRTILPIENPTDTQYLPLLQNSTYTLCPAGKNPEQYRIWEALMSGSIPIIENPTPPPSTPHPAMHPSYGPTYRCTSWDIHRVLKKYSAPVLYVEDWRALGAVLEGGGVVERRRRLKVWFRELKVELRREVFERVKHLNGRREGD